MKRLKIKSIKALQIEKHGDIKFFRKEKIDCSFYMPVQKW